MVIQAAARTDTGQLHKRNEDCFFLDEQRRLFIVCDGLGGHMSGHIASRKAIEFAVDYFDNNRPSLENQLVQARVADQLLLSRFVESIVHEACTRLFKLGKSTPELDGMATTMTLMMIVDDLACVAHVGDSRLYLKQQSRVTQLTSDHTLFAEFVRERPEWNRSRVDGAMLLRFQQVLTRCVGRNDSVPVETFLFEPQHGDVLLMCTDGLSSCFTSNDEIAPLIEDENVDAVADNLIQIANERGGEDNITAIVIRIAGVDDRELRLRRVDSVPEPVDFMETGSFAAAPESMHGASGSNPAGKF